MFTDLVVESWGNLCHVAILGCISSRGPHTINSGPGACLPGKCFEFEISDTQIQLQKGFTQNA